MPSAFISYRRVESAALATLIAVTLQDKHGIEVFVDTRSTDGGGLFPDRLRRAIEHCDVFVCLLGATTLESAWVMEEIEHAHNLRKTMIPVFQERYVPPNPIPSVHVEALLQSDGLQVLDVRNVYVDQAISDLASMIRRSVGAPMPPPRRGIGLPLIAAVLVLLALVALGIFLVSRAMESPTSTASPTQIAGGVTASTTIEQPTAAPTEDAAGTRVAQLQASLTALAQLQIVGEETATADAATRGAAAQIDATLRAAADTATAAALAITQSVLGETATQQAIDATAIASVSTDTPTPSATPTPITLEYAYAQAVNYDDGQGNTAWTPIAYTFGDGVTMVLVPTGCFLMGSSEGNINEQPINEQCFVVPFWIDQTEVTQADFVRLSGQKAAPNEFPADQHPVENITWFEARNFCVLRGARLPTEREWEYAARGPEGWIYPWGNMWDTSYAAWNRSRSQRTAIVGTASNGVSWVGAQDMSGNVWEWASSLYQPYPYAADDGREGDMRDLADAQRVLRGGSWYYVSTIGLRAPTRSGLDPIAKDNLLGFRCARDV
ncbi:MAG: SUMF1/EgtB/PvdO family nonheme iron enzyme [Anaerolineae bacterium]|nr:SUMF1/EgtB/PvdO family nonheme iron enzyme [Anaerolineae bacterium]